jgi:hypothetical protein
MKNYVPTETRNSQFNDPNDDETHLIIQWNITVDTSGSYRFEIISRQNSVLSKFHRPIIFRIDNGPMLTFDHICQRRFVHLSNTCTHTIVLTTFASSIDESICGIDVRLAYCDCNDCPQTLLLTSGQSISNDCEFQSSPSKRYTFQFKSTSGDVLLRDNHHPNQMVIWKAAWNQKQRSLSGSSHFQLVMQGDGNLLLRQHCDNEEKTKPPHVVWKTMTQGNPGAHLVLNDAGQLLVVDPNTSNGCCSPLYFDGIPSTTQHYQDMQRRCQNDDDHYRLLLSGPVQRQQQEATNRVYSSQFPLRGIFYYPWYPTTWTVDKTHAAHFIPKLGKYDSGHLHTIETHVQQLDYAHIDLAISSWWGPDTNADRARLLTLMDVSYRLTRGRVKWCVYVEPQTGDDSVEGLIQKLDYLNLWYTSHPSWLHIDTKPVVFVYNLQSDCLTSQRWVQACAGRWYLVLKWFGGWKDCQYQPQSWHQYGPSQPWHYGRNHFVNISPGFWQAREAKPRLERLDKTTWYDNVRKMVAMKDVKWHLITSFNEAGEGTLIEATAEWDSDSGFGFYLDALHKIY